MHTTAPLAKKRIAIISQKGGVGKSTLARALAVEMARLGLRALLADCDPKQLTSFAWAQDRLRAKLSPAIACRNFETIKVALDYAAANSDTFDILVLDGPARTTEGTLLAAHACDLVIQPASSGDDDLKPAFREFTSLVKQGIPLAKLWIAPCRLSSEAELAEIKAACKGAISPYQQNEFQFNCLTNFTFEKASYKKTLKEGKTLTEDKFYSLRSKAFELVREIAKKLYE